MTIKRLILALLVAVLPVSEAAASCPPAPSISPSNGVVPFGAVTFEWSDVGELYEFFAGLDDDPPTSLFSTTDDSRTIPIEPGREVTWYVVAKTTACPAGTQSPVGTFTTTCPTNPATLVRPADGARVEPGASVNFDWSNVPGAAGYDLQAFIDGEWQILAENLTSSSYTASFDDEGELQWAVRANFDGSCAPLYSQIRDLFVTSSEDECSDAVPVALGPRGGETVTTAAVTFAWNGVPNAERYRLFVAVDQGEFEFFEETEATSVEKLVPRGSIRWFVVARFDDCPEQRSTVATFTAAFPTGCDDAQLTLLAPAEGATTASPTTLRWSSVPGAAAYRVWLSVDGGSPLNVHRTTTTEATLPLPAGEIRWYVEAVRAGGCDPVISDEAQFTVTRGTNCESNPAPGIVAPAGTETQPAVVTADVTFSWAAVDNASAYRVWIARRGEAFEDLSVTRETTLTATLEPGAYAWFVQALYGGCPAVASERGFFVIPQDGPRCSIETPSIVAPANTTTASSPVTFTWTAVANAGKYRVHASVDGSESVVLGVTTATTLTRPLPPGVIRWRVEAVLEECPSTFSPPASFTIARAANCTDGTATPQTPADLSSHTDNAIDFVWSAVDGAVRYVLVARVNDGAPSVLATTSETSERVIMPPGRIEWWVVTFFAGCPATESTHARFTVTRPEGCERVRPVLLLPSTVSDVVTSPVTFQWTHVPGSTFYRVWVGGEEERAAVVATSTDNFVKVDLPPGTYEWFGEAMFDGCPSTRSARADFRVSPATPCGTPRRPLAQVIGQALSGTSYSVRWSPLPNVQLYEVQEATSPDFSDAQTFTTTRPFHEFTHEVTGGPEQFLYRVRGVSACNDQRGAYSPAVGVFVVARRNANGSAEAGSTEAILQTIFLPGTSEPTTFTAKADKPWVTVAPSSGTLTPEGVTLTVSADPAHLDLGTNTATVLVEYTNDSSAARSDATTIGSTPISVSLVTPVMPAGKGTPPPDALIFSVVGHAAGQNNSLFQSDIRLTNFAAQAMKYAVNFTPSGVAGSQIGSSTSVEVAPGGTLALDDIVASVFGTGTTSSATGVLEVRPITSTTTTSSLLASSTNRLRDLVTGASSRTYNFTPTGTFGQFIPATRFADFVGKATAGNLPTILSLQQVAQSSAYRSNFGFVEAAGHSVDLMVRIYDTANTLLGSVPITLAGGEHRQVNSMLAANGIADLPDGRVEVEVLNGDGKITAYVSTVDNRTNDPLLVSASVKGAVVADRYVIPGVAFIDNAAAFWVTDVRIFNAGSAATAATLTFYPSGAGSTPVTHAISLEPGEIEVIDNVIGGLLAQPNGAGGMLVVTTPAPTPLTVTARTYNSTSNGTYGQYIPAVTVAESAGMPDRALQILQLEQSTRFRTNIGLAETTGQPATVEVSLILPDSLATPTVTFQLAANEFLQFPLTYFGVTEAVYNARVSVKVVDGAGRVTAYGSAIDAITQDPTYVPAQ